MEVFIEQIVGTVLGKIGLIAVLFEVADIYLKKADKAGVWESIGNMIRGSGRTIGQEAAEAIPGDQIEHMALKVIERARDWPDEWVRGLIQGLNDGINDPKKRIKIEDVKTEDESQEG